MCCFQASSPDEKALVEAAVRWAFCLGFLLLLFFFFRFFLCFSDSIYLGLIFLKKEKRTECKPEGKNTKRCSLTNKHSPRQFSA